MESIRLLRGQRTTVPGTETRSSGKAVNQGLDYL